MYYCAIYRGWEQHQSERAVMQEPPARFNVEALERVAEPQPELTTCVGTVHWRLRALRAHPLRLSRARQPAIR